MLVERCRADLTGFLSGSKQFDGKYMDEVHALFMFDVKDFCHLNEAFLPISTGASDIICEFSSSLEWAALFANRCSKAVSTKVHLFSS